MSELPAPVAPPLPTQSAFNRVSRLDCTGGSTTITSNVTPPSPSWNTSGQQPFILAPPPAGSSSASSGGGHHLHNGTNGVTTGASPMKVPVKPPPLKSLPPLSGGYGGTNGVPLSPGLAAAAAAAAAMADRNGLPHLALPFSPDLLWRYGSQFSALTAAAAASSSSPASSNGHHGQSNGHHGGHHHHQNPPSSPHMDVKTHLPGALGPDPRTWGREDVLTFLRWCEREFDLPGLDLDKFQMNGKALCLLNKSDIAERAPGSGDVVHNALQLLLRDTAPYGLSARVPSSPLTPSHHAGSHAAHQQHLLSHALAAAAAQQQAQQEKGSNSSSSGGGSHLLSPPNSARTPTSASWPTSIGGGSGFSPADFHSLGHLIQQTNSVTLSPAPSSSALSSSDGGSGINSQGGSPSHAEAASAQAAAAAAAAALAAQAHINFYTQALQAHSQAQANQAAAAHLHGHGHNAGGSNSGSQSDSEENDSLQDSPVRSPAPSTPVHLAPPPMSPVALNGGSSSFLKESGKDPITPERNGGGGGDGMDSGSNGRLLWDFLQQLLNDPSQRYSHYIAWKNRETGVFKITDPAGLARLWGIQKNHPSMNYDKMSRALRYYYRVNILRKVQGERHCYQFLRNPVELKSIKNISLLRHQMAAAAAAANTTTTSSSTTSAPGKLADSTDASSERYSPSSSCNNAEDYGGGEPLTPSSGRNFIDNNNDNDCDMPTDLSMSNSVPSIIKAEKIMPSAS